MTTNAALDDFVEYSQSGNSQVLTTAWSQILALFIANWEAIAGTTDDATLTDSVNFQKPDDEEIYNTPLLQIAELIRPVRGSGTLVAGTVDIVEPLVTDDSLIFLTAQDDDSVGALRVSARSVGVGFTITSSEVGDTGVVAYQLSEPA